MSSVSARRARVVILDDSAVVLKWCTLALQNQYQVLATTSAASLASALTYTGRPTLVLVDIDMPGLRGNDVVRGLARERPPETWFYLHSSMAQDEAADLAAECGADGLLPRCDSAEEFRRAVDDRLAAHARRCLLVAGAEAARLLPGRQSLERMFEIVEVPSIELAQEALARRPVHVLVGAAPLPGGDPEDLYRAVRGTSATRRLSILHLAPASDEGRRELLQGAGANLVLGPPHTLVAFEDAITRLSRVAPRRDLRVPLRAAIGLTAGVPRGTTRNVSVSGLLALAPTGLEVGTDTVVEFSLPGQWTRSITAGATVMRRSDEPRGMCEYGLRFTGLAEKDFDAVAGYVARALSS